MRWLPVGTNIAAEARRAPSAVRRELGLRDAPLLGYFGQLDFTRGVEDLLEAVAELRRGGSDARLVMIGAADSARYEIYLAHAERLGLGEAVVWTPWLGPGEAAELLASVDLCVLPYRRNSLGRSALAAALTLGVPTVLAGTPERIEPLRAAATSSSSLPGDPTGLARTLQRLLDDEDALARLREGARTAARHFAWPRIAEAALVDLRRSYPPLPKIGIRRSGGCLSEKDRLLPVAAFPPTASCARRNPVRVPLTVPLKIPFAFAVRDARCFQRPDELCRTTTRPGFPHGVRPQTKIPFLRA